MVSKASTVRLTERPWDLVRKTMGGREVMTQKLRRFVTAVKGYGRPERVEPRLYRLRRLGKIDVIPTRTQRLVGALDMLRFFITPAAADYYRSKGISFYFHYLLRFLDDPASVIDPTGFNSSRDAIIGHVMQVVHANPRYDFELLESFEGGMSEMQRQVEAVLDGSHPRTESIASIVEDPSYHRRLLEHVRDYRCDPDAAPPLLRENVAANPRLRKLERTFGSLPNAMRYFAKLPRTPLGAVRHLVSVRDFPEHLAVE